MGINIYKNIAVVSANLGGFDNPLAHKKQSVDCDIFLVTDKEFPPRYCSMTSRLQARIVKMFMYQFFPGYDYYIWVDASFSLQHPDSVKWFVEKCEEADIAVLKHPMRNTIQEEANYLKERLDKEKKGEREPYVIERYEGELIDEQLAEIFSDEEFVDKVLYASTALVYKNTKSIQVMLKDWWYHTSRYHSVDQLSLPYVLWKHKCCVNVIPTQRHHDFKIPYLTLVRYL